MNENELYRIELRARSVLAEHGTGPIYIEYCGLCFTRYPCDRRLDAEDTLRLLEWFKTMQEKADGQS